MRLRELCDCWMVSAHLSCLVTDCASETHRLKSKENSDIVLIPQPTDDPNDPLMWPAWKKTVAMLSILWFSGMGGWIVAGVGPALVIIGNEFEKELAETVRGVINWFVLLLGIGVILISFLLFTDTFQNF